ncbi:unnamed protein product [Caenorhabditis bovis]|uniref:Kinesin-like protein n=1 Tax=Caenorhabditis bovis TaxID=2654633 RepID=A0A8S1ERG3_9PELO|nr:unnamed protein product [Caenorhabditis bovis]
MVRLRFKAYDTPITALLTCSESMSVARGAKTEGCSITKDEMSGARRPPTPTVRLASTLKRRSIGKLATPILKKSIIATPTNATRPLQNTLITGRATTFGAANYSRVSTISGRPIANGKENVGPRSSRQSAEVARNGPTTRNGVTSGRGTRSVTGRVGIPPKENPELVLLREKLKMTEEILAMKSEDLTNKTEQLAQLTEVNEFLKKKIDDATIQLEKLTNEVKEKTDELFKKENDLRKLHNDVVDLKGQIRVVVRVRPLIGTEKDKSSSTLISYPSRNSIGIEQGGKSAHFDFENVFTPVFTQGEVFENFRELVLSCLHGYNVSLIAYGQTGSGKTHTMRGGAGDLEGVIPRSVAYIFENKKSLEIQGWQFEFFLSFLEIYNNEVFDLLEKHNKLKVRLAGNDVVVDGLTSHQILKPNDVAQWLQASDRNRKTASTNCNAESSRSHAIFQLTVHAKQPETQTATTSVLKLVDLAGSERANESGAIGDRFKELTFINQSLSALQKCISLQKQNANHVPYRDTKLTQLLKDCIGAGSSKTMVIVNINPTDEQIQESKRSLEFAAKMRETKIGAAVHQRNI